MWILVTGYGPFRTITDNPSWKAVQQMPDMITIGPNSTRPACKVHKICLRVSYREIREFYGRRLEKEVIDGMFGGELPQLIVHVGCDASSPYVKLEECAYNWAEGEDVDGCLPPIPLADGSIAPQVVEVEGEVKVDMKQLQLADEYDAKGGQRIEEARPKDYMRVTSNLSRPIGDLVRICRRAVNGGWMGSLGGIAPVKKDVVKSRNPGRYLCNYVYYHSLRFCDDYFQNHHNRNQMMDRGMREKLGILKSSDDSINVKQGEHLEDLGSSSNSSSQSSSPFTSHTSETKSSSTIVNGYVIPTIFVHVPKEGGVWTIEDMATCLEALCENSIPSSIQLTSTSTGISPIEPIDEDDLVDEWYFTRLYRIFTSLRLRYFSRRGINSQKQTKIGSLTRQKRKKVLPTRFLRLASPITFVTTVALFVIFTTTTTAGKNLLLSTGKTSS